MATGSGSQPSQEDGRRLTPSDPPTPDPTVVTWLHEPGTFNPLARITADDAHAIVTDHLGTPRTVLDADGTQTTRLVHNANGHATITGHANLCPFRFPGQYADEETGLHENRFRFYDPTTGRYLSRDPIGLRGGLSAYAYVSDPTAWIDPIGLAGKPAAGADCSGDGGGGKPFAMGIDQHLDDFAKQHGATTWKQFDDVGQWKNGVLDKLRDPNQRVLFNMKNVDAWPGASRAAGGRGGATDWEFLQMQQNNFPNLEFWKDGQKVPNPFD